MCRDACLLTIIWLLFSVDNYRTQETSELDKLVPVYRAFRKFSNNLLMVKVESKAYMEKLRKLGKLQVVPKNLTGFPCNLKNLKLRSDKKPDSVHKVRPGDIDVVGALGDSLTVGFGVTATDPFGLLYENRGRSFSIGGQGTWRNCLTLPNLLKVYNPNLIGYSLNSIAVDRKSRFNVAENGAFSKDMPYMAKVLVKRMQNDKEVNLKQDWKMITYMIGDNDFCSGICYEPQLGDALVKAKRHTLQALRILRDHLPRTIVNMIPPPHLKVLTESYDKPTQCYFIHLFTCACLFGTMFEKPRNRYFHFMTEWQQLIISIANMEEFDRDDFTVIPHMFTLNYTKPMTKEGNWDYTYLSYDCFHFSQKGHARFANDLWNSIMSPFGKKPTGGTKEFTKFNCPTQENPYIFTRHNSNS